MASTKVKGTGSQIAALVVICLTVLLSIGIVSAQSDTIILGTTDDPKKLPADSYGFPGWWSISQTHEGLLGLDPVTEELTPALATNWSVSNDGTTYTFNLRKGVTFTDGAKVDAQAVKTSFERALRLNGDPVFLIGGIEQVVAVDDYTVRIRLRSPDATFLSKLAFDAPAYITSPNSFTAATLEETVAVTNTKGTIGTSRLPRP